MGFDGQAAAMLALDGFVFRTLTLDSGSFEVCYVESQIMLLSLSVGWRSLGLLDAGRILPA